MNSRPSITGSRHILPFSRLSPADFERMSLWLIQREGFERQEYLGEAGVDRGRDLVATKDGRSFVFQCKRVQRFGPKAVRSEIKKILSPSSGERPDEVLFIVTCPVSARTRQHARDLWGEKETCNFWSEAELDARIKRHPDIIAEFFQIAARLESPTPLWNVPFSRNQYFIGREEVLHSLHELFTRGKIEADPQVAAITGLGGIGKTQAAVEFAYRYANDYSGVFWCQAATRPELIASALEIARTLTLPEQAATSQTDVILAVRRWLEKHASWLLIVDNVETPGLLTSMLPAYHAGHVLLTSRSHLLDHLGIRHQFQMEGLSHHEALDFLLTRTGMADRYSSDEREAAIQLADELDRLPLALEQAGAFVFAMRSTFADYLKSYSVHRLGLLEERGPITGDYPESVATTWSLNFRKVEETSPAAGEILRATAFVGAKDIPIALITGAVEQLGPILGQALASVAEDPVVIDRILGAIGRFSLIDRDPNSQTYSIHRLVQLVVRESMAAGDQHIWTKRIVRTMERIFPQPTFANWALCDQLLPHVKIAADFSDEFALNIEELASLLNRAGIYLSHWHRPAEAEEFYERSLAIQERRQGKSHPGLAPILNNLGTLYRIQGLLAKAQRLYERSLDISERGLGKAHPETAATLSNLASLHFLRGKFLKAELLYRRSLTFKEQHFGPKHPEIAKTLNNLAALCANQGSDRFAEAENLYSRALEIRLDSFGENHPEVAETLNNLALLYAQQGRFDDASSFYESALRIREESLGTGHPDFSVTIGNYLELLRETGRDSDALEILARFENVHSLERRKTRTSGGTIRKSRKIRDQRIEDMIGTTTARIRIFFKNMEVIEEDAKLLDAESNAASYGCIDFYNLYRYLQTDPIQVLGSPADPAAYDDFMNLLIFNELRPRPVLLPPYYEELRSHFSRVSFSEKTPGPHREYSQRLFSKIDLEALPRLRAVDQHSNIRNEDWEEVQETLRDLQEFLIRESPGVNYGTLLGRFGSLVAHQRVLSLPQLLGKKEAIKFPKDTVYTAMFKHFSKRRARGGQANHIDASAISMIAQLNQRSQQTGVHFYLISGSDLMREALESLNRLWPEAPHIQLRDLEYWKIRFTVHSWTKDPDEPFGSKLEKFKADTGPLMQELQYRWREIQAVSRGLTHYEDLDLLEDLMRLLSNWNAFSNGVLRSMKPFGFSNPGLTRELESYWGRSASISEFGELLSSLSGRAADQGAQSEGFRRVMRRLSGFLESLAESPAAFPGVSFSPESVDQTLSISNEYRGF